MFVCFRNSTLPAGDSLLVIGPRVLKDYDGLRLASLWTVVHLAWRLRSSPPPSSPLLPSTAGSRDQWALPVHCRTSPRAPDISGHCSTAKPAASSSSAGTAGPQVRVPDRSQWAPLDVNCELQISVGTAGPQPRAPDLSGHCRTSTASDKCQRDCHKDCQIECQTRRQIECQIECRNIYICVCVYQIKCRTECQIECQMECQKIYTRQNAK